MPTGDAPAELRGLSGAYARLVVAARWWVVGAWTVATVSFLVFFPSLVDSGGGGGLKGILSGDTPAVQNEMRSVELFGFPLIGRTVVVQRNADGLSPYAQARTVVRAAAVDTGRAGDVEPVLGALPVSNTAGLFPGANERDTTALTYLLFAPDASLGARTRAARAYADDFFGPDDYVVGVTGSAPARSAQASIIRDALPMVELATLLAIVVIVGVSFRSLVAPLVTLLTVGVAYVVTLRVSGALTSLLDLPSPDELKPVVVALLLGVVTDYVVFFCSALREVDRRRDHAAVRDVATRAIARSGPIVAVAGLAVAVGTATLLAAESPFFRALGPALAFTVAVGVVVAITLVPALMAILGDAVFWPSRLQHAGSGRHVHETRWRRWRAHPLPTWPRSFVTRIVDRRVVAVGTLAACLGGLLLAATPLLRLQLGVSFVSALPQETPVRAAALSAQQGFAEGILSPTVVLLEGEGVGAQRAALARLETALSRQPGVAGVLGPGTTPLPAQAGVLVTEDEAAARFLVVLEDEPLGAQAVRTIDRLEAGLPELLSGSGVRGAEAALVGDSATASFLVHQTENDLLRIAVAAMLANLLMLLLFLRAVVASVLLLLTSLLSLSAMLGITTAVFEWTNPGQGLTFYVPFAAAVLLLAFGSDYNIFTVGHVWEATGVSRLRVAVKRALPPAIVAVTAAGLALAASFGLLGLVPLLPFRQLAFALGVGILLDVFVVRALVVPAMLRMLGTAGVWPSRRFSGPPLGS